MDYIIDVFINLSFVFIIFMIIKRSLFPCFAIYATLVLNGYGITDSLFLLNQDHYSIAFNKDFFKDIFVELNILSAILILLSILLIVYKNLFFFIIFLIIAFFK